MKSCTVLGVTAVVALVLAAPAWATTYIGVNFNGDAADANGNYGIYGPNGATNLAPGDVVHGQDNWNNVANNIGWQGSEAMNTQTIKDSLGNAVGTVWISSDAGGGPLPGSRYDGTPSSAFPDPGTDPLQILYNGIDFNQNHGTVKLVLTNGVPAGGYNMFIFGSGGPVTVYSSGAPVATTSDSLGTWAAPGFSSLVLPETGGPVTYWFGDHGNWNYSNPWDAGQSPMLSAFQLVSADVQPPSYHPGDANGDGVVDLQDFGLLKDNFGLTEGATWGQGDFTGDGLIDLQDFGVLKDHFGHTTGDNPVIPMSIGIPEPGTLSLLALAGLAIRRKR